MATQVDVSGTGAVPEVGPSPLTLELALPVALAFALPVALAFGLLAFGAAFDD